MGPIFAGSYATQNKPIKKLFVGINFLGKNEHSPGWAQLCFTSVIILTNPLLPKLTYYKTHRWFWQKFARQVLYSSNNAFAFSFLPYINHAETRDNKGWSCDNGPVEYWHKVWELNAGRLQGFRFAAVYCRKPFILPKLVLFFGTFLELPVLPSIICELTLVFEIHSKYRKFMANRIFGH